MRLLRVLGLALLGLPAAAVWVWWAEPATWLVTGDGSLVMSETQAAWQFDAIGTFVVVGAGVGVLIGVLIGFLDRPFSWRSVVAGGLSSLAAALVCWIVGRTWGPDPSGASTAEDGDLVPAELVVDSPIAFLVWPLCTLLVTTVVAQLIDDEPRVDAEAS